MTLNYTETERLSERIARLFRELQKAIKHGRHSILLAVYRSELVRTEVENALSSRLQALGQQTERVYINEQNPDLPHYLRERADRKTTVYFVSGIRFGGGVDGQNGYRALNIRREYFVDYKLRVIFWLTEEEERLLPRYAPDFWAFRHRVITFLDNPRLEQVDRHGHNLAWHEFDDKTLKQDTEAKIAYRERLLSELPDIPETNVSRADLLYTLATLYSTNQEAEKALQYFQQAITLINDNKNNDNSRHAGYMNGLGNVYVDLGRTDEAIAAYQKAIELDPTFAAHPQNSLGILYDNLGRTNEAIATYQKAIELNPTLAQPHNGLGNVYRQLGRTEEAIAAYQKAIELDPSNADYLHNLGLLYRQLGRTEKALVAYQKAVDLEPSNGTLHAGIAAVYRQLGQNSNYEKHIGLARELMDNESIYNCACIEAIAGNVAEAIALLERAIAKNPGDRELAKTDPDFDFIRDDPRFQAVVGE